MIFHKLISEEHKASFFHALQFHISSFFLFVCTSCNDDIFVAIFRIVVAILDNFHFDLRNSTEMEVTAPIQGMSIFLAMTQEYRSYI